MLRPSLLEVIFCWEILVQNFLWGELTKSLVVLGSGGRLRKINLCHGEVTQNSSEVTLKVVLMNDFGVELSEKSLQWSGGKLESERN